MKLLALTKVEQQTLREMGIMHEHYRTRMRAQAILRLSQGLTLQQTADEFGNDRDRWKLPMELQSGEADEQSPKQQPSKGTNGFDTG